MKSGKNNSKKIGATYQLITPTAMMQNVTVYLFF